MDSPLLQSPEYLFYLLQKYLDIPLPVNTITGATAFNTDKSASSVVTGNT